MRIDELLREIEEIINTASGVPLTGKVMVEGGEIIEILNEIERILPDEIKQARWIQNERDRILNEAKKEYETVVSDAKRHAENLVERNEILMRARARSEELMMVTEENIRRLKMRTYDYMDNIMYDFQEQVENLQEHYTKMFEYVDNTFVKINRDLIENRDEIKEMAHRTQINQDGTSDDEQNE